MNNINIIKKIITLIFVFSIFSSNISGLFINEKHTIILHDNPIINESKLDCQKGIKILYLNGSHYQMGYQHGYLLKDEVNENMRAFISYIEKSTTYSYLLEMWNVTRPYIPICYIKEMQGICDGAEVPFENMAVSYMYVLFLDMQCFTYAAWSNATIDGKLYHIRSLDFPLVIQDPLTGKYIQENSVIIVKNPEDGLKSIVPSIAGAINFYQGINEKKISIGVEVCWSSNQTLKGTPVIFKTQKILESAHSLDESIDILKQNKTLGWNFIISDGKIGKGYAIEINSNETYVGTWDDPIEDIDPFWCIENVVRRTNFFINPTLASSQRDNYNPGGVKGFLKIFEGDSFFPLWRKYRSMSIEIDKKWGEFDLNSSINLLRKVYSGKTDFLLFFFLMIGKNSILCDFHQWAVCPDTGDFIISIANENKYAHETDLHYFNINDLFEYF